MAKKVIKKDGTKETFDAGKIKNSILAAAQRTDLSEKRKNEVVERVTAVVIQTAKRKNEIATSEIRENILSELDGVEPAVSEAWRKHEEKKK